MRRRHRVLLGTTLFGCVFPSAMLMGGVLAGCGGGVDPAGSEGVVSPTEARPRLRAARSDTPPSTVVPLRSTPTLDAYEDAPRSPDADDPAIWVPRDGRPGALVLATLKDAGLAVYDLEGHELQVLLPPRRPAITSEDPAAPGPRSEASTGPCAESVSGETFGRFNNVDVLYGVELRGASGARRKVDVAVVTDRGCDRLRFYAIEPGREGGPLFDVTAEDAGRVFPTRFVRPWPALEPAESAGAGQEEPNPLDDQSTAYGLATARLPDGSLRAFVTQRSRAVVGELVIRATHEGKLTYAPVRHYRFPVSFELEGEDDERVRWSPCREEANEEPQLEGLVYDAKENVLYASQEVVGLYRVKVPKKAGKRVVSVDTDDLAEPVRTFGASYWAVPDGDERECLYTKPEEPVEGTLAVRGVPGVQGEHLVADVEGLAIYEGAGRRELVVSSQGDDTFHVFDLEDGEPEYARSFRIEGVGETDGHAIASTGLSGDFARGLLVVQNGKAKAPPSTDPVNGYEYDGSTRFELVPWSRVRRAEESER